MKTYLIIERDRTGEIYAYFETAAQFKKVQSQRGGLCRISGKSLDDECLLDVMPAGAYMVIPVTSKNANIGNPVAKKAKRNGKKTKVSRS